MNRRDIDIGLEKNIGIDPAINIKKGLEIDTGVGDRYDTQKNKKTWIA